MAGVTDIDAAQRAAASAAKQALTDAGIEVLGLTVHAVIRYPGDDDFDYALATVPTAEALSGRPALILARSMSDSAVEIAKRELSP